MACTHWYVVCGVVHMLSGTCIWWLLMWSTLLHSVLVCWQIGEKTDEEFLGDYAELKETPTQRSVLESEGAGVSRAKEDDVVEVLNKVQVSRKEFVDEAECPSLPPSLPPSLTPSFLPYLLTFSLWKVVRRIKDVLSELC